MGKSSTQGEQKHETQPWCVDRVIFGRQVTFPGEGDEIGSSGKAQEGADGAWGFLLVSTISGNRWMI